eukprot:8649714-Pyramimonas_sp.AAC.1
MSLSSKDLKKPTECTILGHISWMRQMMERGIVLSIQWCDTRDMTVDGHAKGGETCSYMSWAVYIPSNMT